MKEDAVEGLLSWAEDRRELKNLMGKFAQCLLLRRDSEIVELFWSQRQDICYGCNKGYYQGRAAVQEYFAGVAARTEKATELLCAALPEDFAGKKKDACSGAGWLEFKPVQDPVIEIYPDGSARAVWYSQGNSTEITPAGPLAFWTFGSYEAMFVKEAGLWKFLKLVYLEDVHCPVGADWRWPEKNRRRALPEFAALERQALPKPNVPVPLRQLYSLARPFTRLPEPPAPGMDLQEQMEDLPAEEALQLHRILAREQIEQLMGRRVFYDANLQRERELRELWVSSPEYQKSASFGGTWGFHVGMEAIGEFYLAGQAAEAPGVACASPLLAPAIQVAGDGKTAKGLWYSTGYMNRDGEALWLCQKIAADFVYEDGRWRIWHLCEVHDSTLAPGHDFGEQKARLDPGEDPMEPLFGKPTIPVLTHDRLFCWSDDFPWMPEPYEGLCPELCYDYAGFMARRWEAAKL